MFTPAVDAATMASGGSVLAEALGAATGIPAVVVSVDESAAVVRALCDPHMAVVAFLPATEFIAAQDQCGAQAIASAVQNGLSWGATAFVVARSSPATSLQDLDGLRWAVPSLDSQAHFLYPLALLEQAGSVAGAIIEGGDAVGAVLAVYHGEADFATTPFYPPLVDPPWQYGDEPEPFDPALLVQQRDGSLMAGGVIVRDVRTEALSQAPDVFAVTRILTLGPAIPNSAVALSPTLPVDVRDTVQAELLAFAAGEACQRSFCNSEFYGWEGLASASSGAYAPLRDMLATLRYTGDEILGGNG